MYFLDVSDLEPGFKEDLLLRLSEAYPCYSVNRFLEKDWWVFGAERLLFSDFGPEPCDTHLTWETIDTYVSFNELESWIETTPLYNMFVDAEEVEF